MRHPHGLRAAAGNAGEADPEIGAAYEGGFYAGKIRYQGILYYLIVAPAATGATGTGYTLTTNKQWKTANTTTTGTLSGANGASNTAAMVTDGIGAHPAANFCTGLSIGGYSDWYLPARYELDIAYENLKPTTDLNNTSWGINPYSVPERTVNRTAGAPAQTSVAAFQSGGAEAFVTYYHWSSTEDSATNAWILGFDVASQGATTKNNGSFRVRAFRREVSPLQVDEFNPLGLIPGDALEGGFFAGYISHTDDGVPTHALIVAPAATGASGAGYTITTQLEWKTTNTTTAGTTSPFDGASNTAAMVTDGIGAHPAANFCTGLSIGGYTDWYLPARYELDIAYENLKSTTDNNNTSWGINPYSVPERTVNRTSGDPSKTSIAAFQSGGAEAFVANYHWSSTEASATIAWKLGLDGGAHFNGSSKFGTNRVRAFRKLAL
jgi:hypothetical protein